MVRVPGINWLRGRVCLTPLVALGLLAMSMMPAAAQVERPVVVIPGILGSKLGDVGCKRLTWGDRTSLWRFEELRLLPNGQESAREHQPCGLIDRVQILGPLKVDAYADLLGTLRSLDFRDGETLFSFPYDWRRSNYEAAKALKVLLDRPPLAGQDVDIVAHSMGGLVARLYIQELGGAPRVKRLITMGTPHLGSARMLEVADGGWGFWANLVAGGLGNVRATALTFPSIYELMPRYPNCCVVGTPGAPGARETAALDETLWHDMPWLPASLKTPEGRASISGYLRSALRLKEAMEAALPPRVDLYPLCTGLIDTTWRVHLDPTDGRIIHRLAGKGDGTVPIRSAANAQLAQCRASMAEHATIFANDAARQHLEWILRPDRHSFEPKAGVSETDIALRLDTTKGERPGVTRIALSFQPSAVRAGESFEVEVGLYGEAALAAADITGTARLRGTGDQGALERTPCSASHAEAKHCLKRRITAHGDAGPTWVDIKLPGADVVADVILIM